MFAKLTGNHHLMANIFNFHKNETFGVLKMHNMSKIWFTNNKFSFWKNLVYDFLIFVFFIFPNFNWLFSKILVSKGSYEVLVRQKHFWSTYFWQLNDSSFKISTKIHFVSTWKEYYNLTFNNTFNMYCCALC